MKKIFRTHPTSDRISLILLLIRLVAGGAMMQHGWGKIQAPFAWMGPDATVPAFLQALAAVSEFGGGVAWILGALTPLASFGLACTMAFATYFHGVVKGDPWVGQSSFELALLYFVIALSFIIAGPGKYSVDKKLFG
ncbi:MAG: DoxX family protein [Bdellovibrionota bacterium]|nr:MAG: DoxX family protein [Pseudomonadota bacterium]